MFSNFKSVLLLNRYVVILLNLSVYVLLAEEFVCFLIGRGLLQKRIMTILRKIEHCVNGVHPVSIPFREQFLFLKRLFSDYQVF